MLEGISWADTRAAPARASTVATVVFMMKVGIVKWLRK
jgi:hypothetical protein